MSAKMTADALGALNFIPLNPTINPRILLYTPPALPLRNGVQRLIIITSWLGGATASRIAVYCHAYQQLYPHASTLLIRTVLSDITSRSSTALQRQLAPARDYIRSIIAPSMSLSTSESSPPRYELVIHSFSHGGCNTALQLMRLLHSDPLPLFHAVILDCCPGRSSFKKAYSAAVHSLPASEPSNSVGRVLLWPMIGAISLLQARGPLSSVEDMRRELNDPGTFGEASRLYLHSRDDAFVTEEDVVSHANEAIVKGWRVKREIWVGAAHCSLPMVHSDRYWSVIKDFLDGDGVERRSAKL